MKVALDKPSEVDWKIHTDHSVFVIWEANALCCTPTSYHPIIETMITYHDLLLGTHDY